MRNALAGIVGDSFVETPEGDWSELDGVRPEYLVKPGSPEETAAVLQLATREGWAVLPAGSGSTLYLGNRPTRGDFWLSTARLNVLREYEPADLTATVESGCTLAAMNREFGENRQVLPLDPPGAMRCTIGGIAATGRTGSLRLGYGRPRDWILGFQAATSDGKLIRGGGKVVKNVAGYDITRLFVGSLGTLGVITQVSVKVRPKPATEMTLVYGAPEDGVLWETSRKILTGNVEPVSMEILSRPALARVGMSGEFPAYSLCVRVAGEEADVRAQAIQLEAFGGGAGPEVVSLFRAEDADLFWQGVSDLTTKFTFVGRIGSVPSRVEGLVSHGIRALGDRAENACYVASPGVGSAAILFDAPPQVEPDSGILATVVGIREQCVRTGGSFVLERAPTIWKSRIDVWGPAGTSAPLMRGMKSAFDPSGILNPGRFVEGI